MAGMRILESGGNVVDAGVATGLCINVLQPDLTNIGGVAPIILYLSRAKEVVTISGLGRWSRKATRGELQERGGDLSGGPLTSIVPSALDAWVQALDRFGTMSFAEVAAPAVELAEGGFPVNHFLHANLSRAAERLENWPSSRRVFLSRGRAPEVGERLTQPALGRTLRRLMEAERGASGRHEGLQAARDVFYKGDMARAMVCFCQQMGGILTDEDLATFGAQVEQPVVVSYRGYDVYACGPWCQGPVVLQALNILEGYDLASLPHNSARVLHLIVEALKAAFADRHTYYGDPEFVSVPIEGLLSKEYAGTWRRRLQNDRAWPTMPEAGNPWAYQEVQGRKTSQEACAPSPGADYPDTSYLCVMDADGNSFSATPSDPATGVPLVPELGCIVSPRGHQSWLDPAHPSCVAPGKRPRLTPSPGLVMKDGHAFMPYGTPGLDVQPQAMVQLLVNIFDYGMDVQSAIEAPRVATYSFPGSTHPHPYDPGRVRAEARISSSVLDELARIGHRVEAWPEWTPKAGALCAIIANRRERTLAGGADPRRLAYAIGW
jgi:gamma-glutamyltranspeptidase/glutathione hydrolase